jgi:hypothetical protein
LDLLAAERHASGVGSCNRPAGGRILYSRVLRCTGTFTGNDDRPSSNYHTHIIHTHGDA